MREILFLVLLNKNFSKGFCMESFKETMINQGLMCFFNVRIAVK